MRIFIQEFISGGGLSNQNLDAGLLVEGFGMLRVLTKNCKKLGLEITITLDKRLKFLSNFLEFDHLEKISSNESFIEEGKKLLQKNDYFLVIAPGTNNLLSNIINEYSNSPSCSLNCDTNCIDFATNKSLVYEFCSKNGFNFPKTIKIAEDGSCSLIAKNQAIKRIDGIGQLQKWELNYPVILKPNDGVACDGIKLCRTQEQLYSTLKESHQGITLVQEFIFGDNLSVTAYVWNGQIDLLSINEQIISLGNDKSEYLGGITNVKYFLAKDVIAFCSEFLSKIDGLRGFIGIDLIVSRTDEQNREIYLIEINPRVTTPICGLMNQTNKPINLMPISGEHYPVKLFDVTYFAKAKFSLPHIPKQQFYVGLTDDPSIITPPISFDGVNIYSLIRGSGKNTKKANRNFNVKLAALSNKLKNEFITRY